MNTYYELDDALVETAQELGYHRSKKEAVTVALDEYVQSLSQVEMLHFLDALNGE